MTADEWKTLATAKIEHARKRGVPTDLCIKAIGISVDEAIAFAESLGFRNGYDVWIDEYFRDLLWFGVNVSVCSEQKIEEYNLVLSVLDSVVKGVFTELNNYLIDEVCDGDREKWEEGVECDPKQTLLDNQHTLSAERIILYFNPKDYAHLSLQEIANLVKYDPRNYMWRFECEETPDGYLKVWLVRTF